MASDLSVISASGARYYRNVHVQRRICEYCGQREGQASCEFVSQLAPDGFPTWATAPRHPPEDLPALFAAGWDISRSLLDREQLIVYFEIDVCDSDAPHDALLRPAQAFFDLEPVYRAVRAELTRLRLPLLDVMTGRGYHFAGSVPLTAPIVGQTAALSQSGSSFRDRVHEGLGMLLEYLAHNVCRRAPPHGVPIVLDGVEVGRGGAGRETASLDLSGYGDPVGERQMRAAFSTYQSHHIRPDIFGKRTARDVPALAAVPRRGRSLFWMLEHARTLDQAAALAGYEDAHLPDVTIGVNALLREYEQSRLAQFHRDFYASDIHPPHAWPETYDLVAPAELVPCVGQALRYPNDLLLKPTVLQQLTRYLMAHGWSPRHVAGLVWSKYGRDYGWGDRWSRLDAKRRAEFDVRVFAGALIAGVDRALDFNCTSSQEKHLCPRSACRHDLRVDRGRLLRQIAI